MRSYSNGDFVYDSFVTTLNVANVLEQLKSRTSAQHRRLEQIVDILNPQRSRESYVTLLADFHAFYAPLEAQIFAPSSWQGLAFNPEARRKLPLLERDLAAFDVRLPSPCAAVPKLQNFAQVLGAMYVLEGATLGGQVIGRFLKTRFELTPDHGAAFFHSYQDRVGEMWLEFRGFLSAQATEASTVDNVIQGALETFEAFGAWLEARKDVHEQG